MGESPEPGNVPSLGKVRRTWERFMACVPDAEQVIKVVYMAILTADQAAASPTVHWIAGLAADVLTMIFG